MLHNKLRSMCLPLLAYIGLAISIPGGCSAASLGTSTYLTPYPQQRHKPAKATSKNRAVPPPPFLPPPPPNIADPQGKSSAWIVKPRNQEKSPHVDSYISHLHSYQLNSSQLQHWRRTLQARWQDFPCAIFVDVHKD